MKQIENYLKNYFKDNNIPLKLRNNINTVKFSVYGYKVGNCSSSTVSRFNKKWFSNKPPRMKLYNYILFIENKKYCTECGDIKDLAEFSNNKHMLDNKANYCKICDRERSLKWAKNNPEKASYRTMLRKAAKLNRTPAWANLETIKKIYRECPKGYHVDHIIGLRCKNISGLHIETNLQYLTPLDNSRKGNKYPFDDYIDKPVLPKFE